MEGLRKGEVEVMMKGKERERKGKEMPRELR